MPLQCLLSGWYKAKRHESPVVGRIRFENRAECYAGPAQSIGVLNEFAFILRRKDHRVGASGKIAGGAFTRSMRDLSRLNS